MRRWQDIYRAGQRVEARLILAHGSEWRSCVVYRVTRSGFPVVKPDNFPGYCLVIDRRADIRPIPSPNEDYRDLVDSDREHADDMRAEMRRDAERGVGS